MLWSSSAENTGLSIPKKKFMSDKYSWLKWFLGMQSKMVCKRTAVMGEKNRPIHASVGVTDHYTHTGCSFYLGYY